MVVHVGVRVYMRSHRSLIVNSCPPVVRGLDGSVINFARRCLARITRWHPSQSKYRLEEVFGVC